MSRRRRYGAVLAAILTAVGGIWIASASAQTDPQPTAPLGTWCPIPATPVAGPLQGCKVVPDPDWTPPTTTPTTTSSTTTTVPTTTTTSVTTTTSTPPASALMGWQLTSTNVGYTPHGSCASLPLYTGPNKPARGTVLKSQRIEKHLDLTAGDVVVEKSCIAPRSTGNLGALVSTIVCPNDCNDGLPAGAAAPVIRDSDISGLNLSASAIAKSCAFDGVGKLYRNHIFGMGSGICFRETGTTQNGLAENNYVHALRHSGDAHHEAATVRDWRQNSTGTRTASFVGNRLECKLGGWETGGLFVQDTWVEIRHVLAQDNYFEGAGYLLRIDSRGKVSNAHSINNRFRLDGAYAATTSTITWSTWRDNHLYDASKPDGKGALVNP